MKKILARLPFQSVPPAVLWLPTISGTAQVGQTLTASAGAWTNSPTSYAYQWNNEGSPIAGATSSTYSPVAGDLGAIITVQVIATNSVGASAPAIGFLASLIKIMPLGDSITAGYNSPGGYRAPLWLGLEADGYNIQFIGSVSGTDYPNPSLPFLQNEGHGGYTISFPPEGNTPPKTLKDGIDNRGWLNTNPDIILLLIGVNDLFAGRTTAQANTDYSALLDDILMKLPNVKIICSSLVEFGAWIDTFNANLQALVATKGPRVSFVDNHGVLTTGDLLDGTHPNQGGYNKMAPVWGAGVKAVAPLKLGPVISTTAFYVSQSTGLDTNAGTQAAPWKTIAKVNAQSFAPGTSVLFKRGDKWDRTAGPLVSGTLRPTAAGTAGNPIVYDAYGTGPNPIIDGSADASQISAWTNIGTNLWQSVQTFAPVTSSAVTITIASPCVVTWPAHGLLNGHPFVFATTGALPTGITPGSTYYVVAAATNTFGVATTAGGAPINSSGAQSGMHTAGANGRPYHNANDIGNLIWGFSPLGGNAPAAVMGASFGTMKGGGVGGVWFLPGSGTTNIAGTSQGIWQFNTDNFKVEVYSVGNPATAMPGLRLAMDADALYINNSPYTIVQNLTLQNLGASGVTELSSNVTIRDCVIQWIGGGNNGGVSDIHSRYGDGFNVEAFYSDVLFERNFVHQIYDGAVSPQSGATPHNSLTLRNNVFYHAQVPIGILNTPGSGSNIQNGLNIYNNTAFGDSSWSEGQRPEGAAAMRGLDMLYDATVAVNNTDIRNNVFSGVLSLAVLVSHYTGNTFVGMVNTIWDYNAYATLDGSPPMFGVQTGGNITMASWRTTYGYETHGLIQIDPSFINQLSGNLIPAPGSSLYNADANLYAAGVVWDFNHNPRPSSGPFTLGAYQ